MGTPLALDVVVDCEQPLDQAVPLLARPGVSVEDSC
jgi:hypothetical protein